MDPSIDTLQAALTEETIRYGESMLMSAFELYYLVLQLILTISLIVIYWNVQHKGFADRKGAAKSLFQVVIFCAITSGIFLMLHVMACFGLIMAYFDLILY
ncbi:MAG: hypothetical protein M0Q99_09860 [Candidatus Cloacimonetes bacterium]|jgi:hypothetical protein|nr:hypothetical protein [Candidatus Cloacimonadota bacterium]